MDVFASLLAESGMADDIANGLVGPMASPIPTHPMASPSPVHGPATSTQTPPAKPAAAGASPPSSGTTAPPQTPPATRSSVATAAELKAR
eukprot:15476750-Heterocapsa_arctica.AAC.1